jgi:hypothetical protein
VVGCDLIAPMRRAAWLIVSCVVLLSGGLGACSSSGGSAHNGVEIIVVNSNKSDVTIYGCGPCKPAARLVGCRNPACAEPKPGQDPSGNIFGWTEARPLPVQYRMVLIRSGKALHCPPATAPPAHSESTVPYAVVYDLTPSGRCIIVSHSPLD